jgi:hypothetical protein
MANPVCTMADLRMIIQPMLISICIFWLKIQIQYRGGLATGISQT